MRRALGQDGLRFARALDFRRPRFRLPTHD
jgi:hypothetical protein